MSPLNNILFPNKISQLQNCFFLLLLWMLTSLSLVAQKFTPKVEQISIEEGLSDRFVKSIYQDNRGFMWLGCKYGLNRYDGKTIKTYTTTSHQFQQNLFIDIVPIYKDYLALVHEKNWLKCKQVVFSIFDAQKEETISFNRFFGEGAPFTKDEVQAIGGGYVIDFKGWVYEIIETTELPVKLRRIEKLPAVIEDYELKSNRVFFRMYLPSSRSKRGIYELKKEGRQLLGGLAETETQEIQNFKMLCYLSEEKALIYSGNNIAAEYRKDFKPSFLKHTNFLHFKLFENGRTEAFSLIGGRQDLGHYHDLNVRIIILEKLGLYVVPENGALEFFDMKGQLVTKIEDIYPEVALEVAYVDDNGRIWLCSSFGAYIIDLSPQLFKQHYVEAGVDAYNSPGVKGNPMRGILEDQKGALWFCIDRGNGISPLVKSDSTGDFYYLKSFSEKQKKFFKDGGTCSTYAIKEDEDGMIWVTDDHYSLYKVDPQTEEVLEHYSYPEFKEEGAYTGYEEGRPFANRAIHINRAEQLFLIGTSSGLVRLDEKAGVLLPFEVQGLGAEIGNVYCIYQNEKGVWVGTNTGLYCYNTKTSEVFHYHIQAKDSSFYLPFNAFTHLHEDQDGLFWLASGAGDGLLKWNLASNEYRQYTMADGLSHNVTYAVYEDHNNALWIPSNKGLMRFNKETEEVDHYLPRDGIPHIEFNTLSHYQAKDGRMYFGGLNGVISFDPQELNNRDTISFSQLQIISVKYLNSRTGKNLDKTFDFYELPEISLSRTFQTVELEFVLLDYFNAKENSYAYKIKGLDKEWTYSDQNKVVLRGLPYGKFTLLIKGRGKSGLWSKNMLEIPVKNTKPYYFQWWFIILLLTVLSGLLWGTVNWRINQLKRSKVELEVKVAERTSKIAQQAEDLKELDKLKSRFFANISHELRTPLTLILGPLRQLRKKQDNGQLNVMERNGAKLLGLVEEILDLSKLEAQKLELEEHPTPVVPFF